MSKGIWINKMKCPVCSRQATVERDANGIGENTGPLRFGLHVGSQYGRPCKNSGELVFEWEQPQPPQSADEVKCES